MTAGSYSSADGAPPVGSGAGPKTVCFDLDGTLCTNTFGDYAAAQPFEWAIRRLNGLAAAGHRIVVFTARGTATGIDWEPTTREQLERWGVRYDVLQLGKPSADVYVDDRALHTSAWRAGDAGEVPALGLPPQPGAEQVPGLPPAHRTAVVEHGRTFAGSPFMLDAHVARVCALAEAAGLTGHPGPDVVRQAVLDGCAGSAPEPGSDAVFTISIAGCVEAALLDVLDEPQAPALRVTFRPLAEAAAGLSGVLDRSAARGPAVAAATDAAAGGWPLTPDPRDGSLHDALGGQLGVCNGDQVTLAARPGPRGVAGGLLADLAAATGIELSEAPIATADVIAADAVFVATMPFGMVWLASLDGRALDVGGRAGPELARELDRRAGLDVAAQVLDCASGPEGAEGPV